MKKVIIAIVLIVNAVVLIIIAAGKRHDIAEGGGRPHPVEVRDVRSK